MNGPRGKFYDKRRIQDSLEKYRFWGA